MSEFKFTPLPKPVEWSGRYNRIPGKEPAFKVTVDDRPYAYWSPWKSDEWLTSMFIHSPATRQMGKFINQIKREQSGKPGGSFHINEYGQVITPIYASYKRFWVGNVKGLPFLDDPRAPQHPFCLCPPADTQLGAPWNRPYIGMKYNMDNRRSIYFQFEDEDFRYNIRPAKPPKDLIRKIEAVRGAGTPVRFIVNLHGAVITKKAPEWQPVFVGFIKKTEWFPKEP